MATYTAPSGQTDDEIGHPSRTTGSWSTTVQTEPGVSGVWDGPSTRTGNYQEEIRFAGTPSNYHPGHTPTQSIGGWGDYMDASAGPARTGDWSGPTDRQSYPDADDAETGALIPSSYFRLVKGNVYDEDGEPIPNALYIGALGSLPTIGTVGDDGSYQIYLLRQKYSDLILMAKSPGQEPYDLVRYELADMTPDLDIQVDEADLYFDTTTPSPVYMGHSVEFGGPL